MTKNIKIVNQEKNFTLQNITPINTDLSTTVLVIGNDDIAKNIILELKKYNIHVVVFANENNTPVKDIINGVENYQLVNIYKASELRRHILSLNPDWTIFLQNHLDDKMISDLELKDNAKIFPSKFAITSCNNRNEIKKMFNDEFEIEIIPHKSVSNEGDIQKAFNAFKTEKLVLKSLFYGETNTIIQKNRRIPAIDKKMIVEKFVESIFEFALPVVSHSNGLTFFDPIQLEYKNGFYSCMQPITMPQNLSLEAMRIATKVVKNMTSFGIYFVKFFVFPEKIIFNSIIVKPHQIGEILSISTGFYDQYQLHVRAMLGYPIPSKINSFPSASVPIIANKKGIPVISNISNVFKNPSIDIKLFSLKELKTNSPTLIGEVLAQDQNIDSAKKLAKQTLKDIKITYN